LIISIHHNAGGGHGFAQYHSIKGGIGQEVSEVIARHFKAAGQEPEGITGILQRGNSKGNADYYFIHRLGIPEKTILSEYAFMDSADYEIIDTKPELEKEAEAIFNAIQEFNGVTPNNPIAALQKALQRAGFNWLIVTGVMDAGTREAIKQFKVKYNIVDSIGSTALTKEAQDKLREFYL
jgi:nicotinamidase-related amidase